MATITGTNSGETLSGTSVADLIYGLGGNDTLNGLDGDDVLIGGAGADRLNGGSGFDSIDYSASGPAVNVNLTTGAGLGGDAEGDVLTSIEVVVGSGYGDTLTASSPDTLLRGGAGNDIYVVGSLGVYIEEAASGGGGADEVRTSLGFLSYELYANVERLTYTGSGNFEGYGNAGNNVLIGGAGDDYLSGGAGADRLLGGAGTDTAGYNDGGAVTINLKTGVHAGDAAGDTFTSIEKFFGSYFDDIFVGTATANMFDGNEAFDTIDYSTSEAAVNVNLVTGVNLGGDAEGDVLASIEVVIGSAYGDTLTASSGYVLRGGAGNDIYVVGDQDVAIDEAASGGGASDQVRTALGSFSIAGYANVERLTYTGGGSFEGYGNAGNNVITGGAGDDYLSGGAGADQLIGGAGTDAVFYDDGGPVTVNLKTGVHTGDAAGDTFSSIEWIIGSSDADTFVGTSAANNFNGAYDNSIDTIDYSTSEAAVNVNLVTGVNLGGDAEGDVLVEIERVIGSAYGDTLTSSSDYVLQGGAGNDIYVVGDQYVSIVEAASGGGASDQVRTALGSLSIAGYANVERLTYTGGGNFEGYGNAGNNIITGGAGDDYLAGGAGADQFIGGAGTDAVSYDGSGPVTINLKTGVHTGDAAGDTFSSIELIIGSSDADTFVGTVSANNFNGGYDNSIDTIDYSTSDAAVNVNLVTGVNLGGDAEGDVLTLIEGVIGSAYGDTLTADLSGDVLRGGAGNDIYVVGDNGVFVDEAVSGGGGADEVRTALGSFSIAGYANVERLTFTGSGSFEGYGNAGNNVIIGGAGDDYLAGGAGADRFLGGAGTDTVSYIDSNSEMTLNFSAGSFSGIGNGDTFTSIENIAGSNFGDLFLENASAHNLYGGDGIDTVSYEASSVAIIFDMMKLIQSGIAAGDILSSIEVIKATSQNDRLIGDDSTNFFIGGQGADYIDGGLGADGAWYISSASAIQVNLLSGVVSGGDAAGDVIKNTENIVGSSYDDSLIGNSVGNKIDGADGNDVIDGGDGADTIYGGLGSDVGSNAVSSSSAAQVDILHGGNGNDTIVTAEDDVGSVVYGEAGLDKITISNSIAYGEMDADTITVTGNGAGHGGDGDDRLNGNGYLYNLYGDAGNDSFDLNSTGDAYGGEGADKYNVYSSSLVGVTDTGSDTAIDYVFLNNIEHTSDVSYVKIDNNLYVTSKSDVADGFINSGVYLEGWYAGGNTIEFFVTGDGASFSIVG